MDTANLQLYMEQFHVKEIQKQVTDSYTSGEHENTHIKMSLGTHSTTTDQKRAA